jgi:hypothetical protein
LSLRREGWLVHLLLIRKVPVSNICPNKIYPAWGFSGFPQFTYVNAGILCSLIWSWPLPFLQFSALYSVIMPMSPWWYSG